MVEMIENMDHEDLVNYVSENSSAIFGEEVNWTEPPIIRGEKGYPIRPDLFGHGRKSSIVIVEVKKGFKYKNSTNMRDDAHKSIGQILDYANMYIRQHGFGGSMRQPTGHVRLFIVGDYISKTVENICEFLTAKNISIKHKSVQDIIAN